MTNEFRRRQTLFSKNIQTLIREISAREETIEALNESLKRATLKHEKRSVPVSRTLEAAAFQPEAKKKGRAAVVCWDLAHNPAGRAAVIYDLLERDWNVELVGPVWSQFGSGVWPPIAGSARDIRTFPCDSFEDFFPLAAALAASERYDLVVIVKPRLPGLLLGAMIQRASNSAVLLDIDDLELAFLADQTPGSFESLENSGFEALRQPYEDLATRACESLIGQIPVRTVSNIELQRRYGGVVVRHARDSKVFHPGHFDRGAARLAMGIEATDFVILFVGTPRPHKGVSEIANVLHSLHDKRFVLHIVGASDDPRVCADLEQYGQARIVYHRGCNLDELPEKIAAADAVVLLQDPTSPISHYQMPAKLSDAAAFGLPILASEVPPFSDMIAAGLVVPTRPETLQKDLLALIEARELGHLEARAKAVRTAFLAELSNDVNALRLGYAVDRAISTKAPIAAFDRLLALAERAYSEMRLSSRSSHVHDFSRVLSQSIAPVDLVMFWKQNDSELFGRRPDMLMKYLQESGRVRRILQFDASLQVESLSCLATQINSSDQPLEPFVIRNVIDDQYRLRDRPNFYRRTFLWSHRDTPRRLLPDVGTSPDEIAAFVQREMAACGMSPDQSVAWVCPVVFNFPIIANAIPFRAIIGDLIDDERKLEMQEGMRRKIVKSYEDSFPLFDVTLTNCTPMQHAFANLASKIYVVPNGAELVADPKEVPLHPRITRFPHPVVGYAGNLRDRINWPLLTETARLLPQINFVVVGGGARSEDLSKCASIPNLHMLGTVPYDQIQSVIRSFDVSIMPHLVNEQTQRMNPLKIYNYLALGRPVVTTPVANIDADLEPFIRYANTPRDFAKAIIDALTDPLTGTPTFQAALVNVAWESRVATIIEVLDLELGSDSSQTMTPKEATPDQ